MVTHLSSFFFLVRALFGMELFTEIIPRTLRSPSDPLNNNYAVFCAFLYAAPLGKEVDT
jgi:hypothetical protein